MEFWGVEVKPGQPLKVDPEMGKIIHISQAALGEVKDAKSAKNIPLRLKIDDKKFIIGSLAAEDRTQMMFDLVFEREFELSHDWKHGSVYFIGYIADDPISDGEDFDSDDDSEEEELEAQENGEVKGKPVAVKEAKGVAGKTVVKKEESSKIAKVKGEEDDESDSDEEMGEENDSSDDQDSDNSADDSSEEEEEELPKKSKKRAVEPVVETPPVSAKKAKSSTSDKTGSKKAHVATPFPSKPGKTPAGSNMAKDNKPGKSSQGKAKQGKK